MWRDHVITHDRQNGTPAAGQWRVRAMDQYGGSTLPPGGRAAPVACTLAAATPVVLGQRPARCGVPQFQLPQRTPGQTRQARDGRRGPPGGAWAGPGARCGVGPAWVLGLFASKTPIRGVRWVAGAHSLSRPSFAKAPYCALLSAQPRPAAGRATPWPGPPCDRPPQSASVEEVSRPA